MSKLVMRGLAYPDFRKIMEIQDFGLYVVEYRTTDNIIGVGVVQWCGPARIIHWVCSSHPLCSGEDQDLEYVGLMPLDAVDTRWNLCTMAWVEEVPDDQG